MFRNPQSFQILIFLILFIVCPTSLRANILNEQNPLDRILDQQKLEQQKEKLLEKPEISETKDIKRKYKRTSPNCVEVEKVEFSKADKLTQKARSALSEEVLGKCVFNDQIGEFLGNITNYYIKKGYTNARPYFQAYDLESKTLKIMVLEGIIEQIRLQTINPDGNNNKVSEQSHASKFLEKAQIFFAFPTKAGDIFKIADIEQGVDNMNRLRSNNAVIDSRPSTAVGESEVIVNNYKKLNSWEVGIGYANSGSKSTGIYNTTYRINKDNLFCVNDNISFTQTKSEGSETNMFNISIPFGYYRFSYTNSYNHYTSKAGVS
ncbi:MAG: hemolysin activation/secretion protein, partial [Lentimonas sp.]